MNYLNYFRVISFIEGISYLILVFIAMPLKYLGSNLIFMKTIGMGHGVLFILFLIALVSFFKTNKQDKVLGIDLFIYSLVPFGFILIESRLKKEFFCTKS